MELTQKISEKSNPASTRGYETFLDQGRQNLIGLAEYQMPSGEAEAQLSETLTELETEYSREIEGNSQRYFHPGVELESESLNRITVK